MTSNRVPKQTIPKLLAEAYPNLSPEEQAAAGERLEHYLATCLEIWERLDREGTHPWALDSKND